MTSEAPAVAIIGSACRFAGASSSPSRLWQLLRRPRDVASCIPADRFSIDAFYHPDPSNPGTTNAREAYFLDDNVRAFDASFFNISPNEASAIDPQQRLLLETVYESLDTAGLRLDQLHGSDTAVYCGSMSNDYVSITNSDMDAMPQYCAPGTASSMTANRISYFFDWHGPSVCIDTACSSSLVAMNSAVEALRNGECSLAITAASSLILSPHMFVAESKLHMLSPTSRCHMWDDRADGYARGEGVACIVLKRLSDALRDGDPIECVVRGIGINSDGRGKGLTVPNSKAQQQLIRSTYLRAGLDPTCAEDRCQFFEAHGTGTPAGDPEEAAAIYNAFFQDPSKGRRNDSSNVIHVGSIKTVIGHTEAAAGLAGIIKASLCLQHAIIPPNLHFHRLNPNIQPFSTRLIVPIKELPWPPLSPGTRRRVSINSFGLGGTNAHVILESFDHNDSPPKGLARNSREKLPVILPFIFTAASPSSFVAVLGQYKQYLEQNPDIDLLDLAASLIAKKTQLKYQAIFTAVSIRDLVNKLQEQLNQSDTISLDIVNPIKRQTPKRTLGVFTGQGAQWPQMCLDLISTSVDAFSWLQVMQKSLDELPPEYRPDFSMIEELSAPDSSSRLNEAIISLPIRTAVQIIQVNILRTLGITFDVVVGHSSGEIAAAYAAGILTSSDAIRIAYLRGFVVNQHKSAGGMLAVDLSWEQAKEICTNEFLGKIEVAACNSPYNITLSGDLDALEELKWLLESLGQSPQLLRVDTAYHSHHMLPCAEPYCRALNECGIQITQTSTKWFSSVLNGDCIDWDAQSQSLRSEYWKDNMVRPVMFSQALSTALTVCPEVDAIFEIGPHPALKGPSLQILSNLERESNLPYISLAERKRSSIESLSMAVGLSVAHLGVNATNLAKYIAIFDQSRDFKFIRNLPSYPFDHTQSYWAGSRLVGELLHRSLPPNALLGNMTPKACQDEWSWRNFLSVHHLPWLVGHCIDSRIVFPAAGYISMVVEAAVIVAGTDVSLCCIEIEEFNIDHAIIIPANNTDNVETLFQLKGAYCADDLFSGSFNCLANFGGKMQSCASGRVTITFGNPDPDLLPLRVEAEQDLRTVDVEDFYSSLSRLGLNYSGPFQALMGLSRKMDVSSGIIKNADGSNDGPSLRLHPANLDAGLHGLCAALSAPGDGQQSPLAVPVGIDRITVNPLLWGLENANHLSFDSYITKSSPAMTTGDVHIFDQDGHGLFSIENVKLCPILDTSPTDNDLTFSSMVWGPLVPNSLLVQRTAPNSNIDWRDVERVALLYIRDAHKQLLTDGEEDPTPQGSCILAWMGHVIASVRGGQNKAIKHEWLNDSLPSLLGSISSDCPQVELQTIQNIGQNLVPFLHGESISTASIQNSSFLGELYNESEYIKSLLKRLSGLVAQIVFRFPSMKILEIGARNASTTCSILGQIGRAYHSYTCTDSIDDHFKSILSRIDMQDDRLIFSTFDVELDPLAQGFEHHFYDLIIDPGCRLQTLQSQDALSNIRKILKPGGFLVSSILDDSDSLCAPLIFGACASDVWWSSRTLKGNAESSFQMRDIWEDILLQTGFTGVETLAPSEEDGWGLSVTVSRAADDRILLRKDPLSSTRVLNHSLVLVGGSSNYTTHLVSSLFDLLTPYFPSIVHSKCIEELDIQDSRNTVFMLLEDMDKAVFYDISEQRLLRLQHVLNVASTLLWVSPAHDTKDPFIGMSKGFLRSVAFEYPSSKIQHLCVKSVQSDTATQLAQILMRLLYADPQNDYRLPDRVDNYELELLLTGNGHIMVPRMQWSDSLNQRHLSGRYAVKPLQVDIQSAVQVIGPERMNDGKFQYHFDRVLEHDCLHGQTNQCSVTIQAEYSALQRLPVNGNNFFHVIVGRNTANGEQVVALSEQHASVVMVPLSRCHRPLDDEPTHLKPALVKYVTSALLALHIVTMAPPGTTILVCESHNAGEELQAALSYFSQDNGTRVFLSTSRSSIKGDPNTIFFHEKSSIRQVSRLLPGNISLVLDMSENNVFSSHIKAALPQNAMYLDMGDICQSPSAFRGDLDEQLMKTFERAVEFSKDQVGTGKTVNSVPAHHLPDISFKNKAQLDIVDWTHTTNVPVPVRTASSLIALSAHKSYLLVGMTGNLGRSLAEWMIDHGARIIVLASRSPRVNSWWITKMSKVGARILYMAMDVGNRDSVVNVHHAIREQQLPPVGGVVNGAMILNDSLFGNMNIKTIESTFKPKVQGSLFLDELYRDPKELDFFILVGSLTGPIGNPGQTAYGAAATFMSSLVRQRREQFNLPGSVIHPGAIIGLGYLENVDRGFLKSLTDRMGPTHLSERDFHELFAEGILAGRPGSGRDPEVIAGFRQINPKDYPDALCYAVPKLWPFINYNAQSSATEEGFVASNTSSIKVQLEQATSNEQVLDIISTGLITKLRAKLGLSPDQGNICQETQLAELGVDSLIALDLRSWFNKEIGVDVSILEILSGVSIGDLVHSAALRRSEDD
ncbi:Lovastatin nonaketide synthase [Talaromyces islandicus]|uniref:Lovastatin nonaketide synthase n=1 Tax=Talaromyces islandicus TaxID=28573 RepID=A0A0U1LVC6_TALIS|nr:Lovastatin nonaketide synthase [Talaromyces islandicus]